MPEFDSDGRVLAGVLELAGPDDVAAWVGRDLEPGAWHRVEQSQIDMFAAASRDRQWIHVDPVRATEGPFGTTIAHGFLSLSLLPHLVSSVYSIQDMPLGINYGFDRIRFTSPVPVSSRIRARVRFEDVAPVDRGIQLTQSLTVEIEGSERPALVARWLTRHQAG